MKPDDVPPLEYALLAARAFGAAITACAVVLAAFGSLLWLVGLAP